MSILAACGSPTTSSDGANAVTTSTSGAEVTTAAETVAPSSEATAAETVAPSSEATAATTGSGTLRIGTGDSGDGLAPHNQIIKNYEQEAPGVLVRVEPVAGSDYYTRLLTQLAAKSAPDLMQVGDDAVPNFVSKGAFVPLDAYLEQGFDASIYLPGLLEPGQYQGKQYLLPKDYSTLGVYYNKKLFDAAGVPVPTSDWTWEQLLDTAQKMTTTNADGTPDVYGIQLPGAWTTGFEYWVAAAGGTLISPDGKNYVGFMDSPEVIRAVQFYADLYRNKLAPLPADMNAFGGGNSEFDNGKAAMRIFGRWPQESLKTNPNVELGVVAPPRDKQRANILFWGGFGIASTTAAPDQAWNLLSYYTGAPAAEVWKDWGLPTVKSVADEAGLTNDPIEKVWIGELDHLTPRAYTFTPYWGDTADPALSKALQTVIIDPDADVATVMEQAAQEAQQALDAKQP